MAWPRSSAEFLKRIPRFLGKKDDEYPQGFNNATILPPRLDRPHIVRIDGYWRVSKAPKKGCSKWTKAHAHARILTSKDRALRAVDTHVERYSRMHD